MDKKANNFSVGSKGHCFLCLNKISTRLPSTVMAEGSSVYSLQDVARYLKVDMRKAFIDGGHIPTHLLAKVEKSRLKVELCDGCGWLTDNISKLCRQLEKLKMDIASGLESIHGRILEANETGRTEQFRGATGCKLDSGMGGGIEIMEALRMETLQKCSRKIVSSPRLKLQKLTSKEIRRQTLHTPNNEAGTSSERMPDSGFQPNILSQKKEPDNLVDSSLEEDNHSEASFNGELEGNANDSVSTIREEGEAVLERLRGPSGRCQFNREEGLSSENNSKLKIAINRATGKYNCQLCSMEYVASSGLYYHYNSVHRRVRFKCKICGKEFKHECSYKTHHQNVHLGIRFQCQVCKKIFSLKSNLMAHQRKAGCGIKVEQRDN